MAKIGYLTGLFLLVTGELFSQTPVLPAGMVMSNPSGKDFHLVDNNSVAVILVDQEDQNTVKLCAGLFADDVERVTGKRPLVVHDLKEAGDRCVMIGSMESGGMIKRLISKGLIDVSGIRGQWEASLIQVVQNPFPGIKQALVIAGSDRRGTAYGLFELSRQMGVSPWYYFADVPVKTKETVAIRDGRHVLKSPSVKYRGIFINDEMWGLRPWAMFTNAPQEGRGIGPSTYKPIFELMLRLKANLLWPAMHQNTKPFNEYPENRVLADEYGIIMGSSHIEPMLRNNMGGAEWDKEYPGEPWDYVKNRDHIYRYWEDRVKTNGRYENMYTLGKRGQDDEAGSDITVPVLERIISDQRAILRKWVNRDVTRIPQVLIAYTEVLDHYNKGLKVPEDVVICWPDDNFGNIRQLPNEAEQKRSGGSGVYYHFQWLNGATTAYTWTCTTPLALTWFEMKKAWDFGARKLWVVNVGDIKPAEINIEYFMDLAWDVNAWNHENTPRFVEQWAAREFGPEHAAEIGQLMQKHYELSYERRPENLVMWDGRSQKLNWEWFSLYQNDDEAGRRIEAFQALIGEVDRIYESLSDPMKDAFFQTVVYNVKGAALQNLKVLNAQKSHTYGLERRASAVVYAARAQMAEDEIHRLIHHYNRELITVGSKWDRMASLPGPWGGQWHQWDMPPLSTYSGEGEPALKIATEGGDSAKLPAFSRYSPDKGFIDLYNTGTGAVYWKAVPSAGWIRLSETTGVIYDEKRIWIDMDPDRAPRGESVKGHVQIYWSSSVSSEWTDWTRMTEDQKRASSNLVAENDFSDKIYRIDIELFNPEIALPADFSGVVEYNGRLSMEAENFTQQADRGGYGWRVIHGLGRSGNSVSVLPPTSEPLMDPDRIVRESPLLEYEIFTFTPGDFSVQIQCSPSYPIHGGYGQRIAISVDGGPLTIMGPLRGSRIVMDNRMILSGSLTISAPGPHILKIWMVDPGVVLDKIDLATDEARKP